MQRTGKPCWAGGGNIRSHACIHISRGSDRFTVLGESDTAEDWHSGIVKAANSAPEILHDSVNFCKHGKRYVNSHFRNISEFRTKGLTKSRRPLKHSVVTSWGKNSEDLEGVPILALLLRAHECVRTQEKVMNCLECEGGEENGRCFT